MDKENREVAVHLGKQDSEEYHIIIRGTLDDEFFQELQELLLVYQYTESL